MALNKNLIVALLDWKFRIVNKQGAHQIVSMTDEGRNALKFSQYGLISCLLTGINIWIHFD